MQEKIEEFRQVVWAYYDTHGRHDLPWRLPDKSGAFDPYKILVSEIMLQQTQVNRVIVKYESFLRRFPDARGLAAASLGDVLVEWQGLGYNRRAKFLWQAAQKAQVVIEQGGIFPDTLEALVELPGVGPNTAGAVLAYAYNKPAVFIETNIRTVFIHHFFHGQTDIPDKALRELVEKSLPQESCRNWYWALMDYGTHIKQTHGNKSRASKSYARQSRFEGSWRQVRGAVIRGLSQQPDGADYTALQERIGDERLDEVLRELEAEGMITQTVTKAGGLYRLS